MSQVDQHIPEQLPPQAILLQMIWGGWLSQYIHAAAKLGVADLLREEERSAEELAAACGAHGPSLRRLLRALAHAGIFAETGDNRFALTPLASCLISDSPGSMRDAAIMFGEEWHRSAWTHLLYSVKTGEPAFPFVFKQPFFSFLAEHPEASRIFSGAMTSIAGDLNPLIEQLYDFSRIDCLVDVGGGHGSLMTAILQANPGMRGMVYDQPLVIEGAKAHLQESDLAERCECKSGDFFQSVPDGGDAYLLKFIIHDWADDPAATILKNCRKVMAPHARLLLVEQVLPAGNEPSPGIMTDVEMMVMVGGKERTEAEFRQLLSESGFALERVIPIQGPLHIIEAIPV